MTRGKRCWQLHDWSQWEIVTLPPAIEALLASRPSATFDTIPASYLVTKRVQRRQCARCGRVQESDL